MLPEMTFHTKVVGVTFRNDDGSDRQRIIRDLVRSGELEIGTQLFFVPQPTNPYDRNCILVNAANGKTLGCLSRDMAEKVSLGIKQGREYKVSVASQTGGSIGYAYGINLRVECYAPDVKRQTGMSRSEPAYTLEQAKMDYQAAMNAIEEDCFDGAICSRLEKAANFGLPEAMGLYAQCFDFGYGRATDEATAAMWYERAAQKGDAVSQGNLANDYLNGTGVSQNYEKAFYWATKAANQGETTGLVALGMIYEKGLGKDRDDIRAFELYLQAASAGSADGAYNVGIFYLLGRGTRRNAEEAAKWNRIAAEQGHAKAMFNLANQYLRGEGVPRDINEGAKWLLAAAENGHPKAIQLANQAGLM